jgi:DNA-binding transcriptional LysR family regulator
MDWADRIDRRLKLRDLRILMAVVQCGTMGKAADGLSISQPVVSKAIADLERSLGVQLLDRSSQGVEPTLYGRALIKRSVAIFDELRQSVKEIEFLADPNAGELRVGCNEAMAGGLVPAVIDRLSRRFPQVVFQMELGSSGELQTQILRERKCELVIARQMAPSPEPDMDAEVLFHEQQYVWAGPRSQWLGRRKIALAELVNEPWILTPYDIQLGGPIFEAFRAIGLEVPRARISSGSLNLRNSLMATGRFLTTVPGSVLRFGPKHLSIKVLPIELPRWRLPTAIITSKNRTLSPLAQLFIDCARELAKPLGE